MESGDMVLRESHRGRRKTKVVANRVKLSGFSDGVYKSAGGVGHAMREMTREDMDIFGAVNCIMLSKVNLNRNIFELTNSIIGVNEVYERPRNSSTSTTTYTPRTSYPVPQSTGRFNR